MDIRNIFKATSEQLLAEFKKSAEVEHPGGKGDIREDAFRKFLIDYLPKRYGVGNGEVITPENKVSGQLDIVIYDPAHCPALIASTSHSVYPVESVYGAISMKSHLDSAELADAYKNIASLKQILLKQTFQLHTVPGLAMAMGFPMPVTGVVAYGSNRSLEAIASQAKTIDERLPDITLRPDFIAVIGQGIVAPRTQLRGQFNKYKLPDDRSELVQLRKTGRHTLLRLYMQILVELNALTLRPLELSDYDNMPRLVGPYRVGRHSRFARIPLEGDDQGYVLRLNQAGVEEIVCNSKPVTFRQHMLNYLGQLPRGTEVIDLEAIVYEYNPKNLPPISLCDIKMDAKGRPHSTKPVFQPIPIEIDGKQYAVDFSALTDAHLENDTDFTVDELMSG